MTILFQQLLDILTKVTDSYVKLLENSRQKTNLIKTNDIDALSKLLVSERKLNQQVELLEGQRQEVTEKIFANLNIDVEEKTVTELLKYMTDDQIKKELEEKVVKLVEIIVEIREIERLNEELIQQSLQFVQLSLDLLQPVNKTINYNDNTQNKNKNKEIQKRSVFDSKA